MRHPRRQHWAHTHNAGGRTGSLTADIMTVICYQGASMLVLSGHITAKNFLASRR